jgi:hypothetical protein
MQSVQIQLNVRNANHPYIICHNSPRLNHGIRLQTKHRVHKATSIHSTFPNKGVYCKPFWYFNIIIDRENQILHFILFTRESHRLKCYLATNKRRMKSFNNISANLPASSELKKLYSIKRKMSFVIRIPIKPLPNVFLSTYTLISRLFKDSCCTLQSIQ